MDFKPFKIGKYLLLERLATGGMAEVYRAKASGAGGFEKQLAIKRILPTYSQNEEFRRMFEYEARLSSMLTHANIVQVYDFVKSGETYLLAMEYVDGKNLRQFVNKARKLNYQLPLAFSAWIINEVCKGLEYAHSKKDDLTGKPLNIIHRDMSPQNIMLSYDGAVKIVDFGIAKAKDRVDETRSGVIKGKFGYMSPEQANGQNIDHRSDIFSTGIILFELVTGKRLFSAENDMATLKLIQECIIPTPTRVNPKIPAEFEKIILKALTKDVNLRYQNAGNFHRNVQAFLSKNYPAFTQKDAADIISQVFRQEIESEKKRFEQIYRQSIPFSQGEAKLTEDGGEDAPLESPTDGEVTKSEKRENTPVTFVDDAPAGSLELEDDPLSQSGPASSPATGSESTRIDDSLSVSPSVADPTTVDSLIVEDDSVPTMEKGQPDATRPATPTDSGEKTLVDDAVSIPEIVRSGGNSLRSNPSIVSRGSTSPTGKTPTPSGRTPVSRSGVTGRGSRTNEGLILRNDTGGQPRRRDRSISALTEISDGNDPISLVSVSQERSGPPPGGLRETFYTDNNPDFRPARRSRLGSILFFALIAIGTAYGYRLYLDGKLPMILRMLTGEREPAGTDQAVPTPLPTETAPVRPTGDCTLEITTDPAGARVFVGSQEVGITATTVSGQCGSALNLTIRLDGYEPVSQNEFLKDGLKKIYKTLKRIPSGRLDLILNRNATVFVDGRPAGEARANETFSLTLRAPRTYKIRFVNEIFGIDVTREFSVELDSVSRQPVRLEGQ